MKTIGIFLSCFLITLQSFCQYSNIQKIDFYSGNPSKIAWAGAFINYIEQKNFSAIKENFGIDSTQLNKEANFVNKNFSWPQEVTPGWLRIDDGKDHYVRTYFDKLGDTYTYQYQIEVSFDKGGSPAIDFRLKEKVITLDDILNLYYRRIENMEDAKPDPDHPCEKIIIPDEKWLEDAKRLVESEDRVNADILFDKYLWKNPENEGVYREKIINLVSAGKLQEAITSTTKLLSFSDEGYNYYLRGVLYNSTNQLDLALLDFKMGKYGNYNGEIIDIYLKQNKPQEALQIMEDITPSQRSYNFYCQKAQVYKTLGQVEKYKIALDSCVLINEKDKSNYRSLASSLFRMGEYNKSVVFHKKSLSIESVDKSSVLLDLAEALITDYQYAESEKITNQLLLAEGLSKKDRFIYLYLNLIAKGLSKSSTTVLMKEFDAIINNNEGIEKGTWDFIPFMTWIENSTKLKEEEKKFVNDIIIKAKSVL